jgi:hypothetical protein
MRRAATATLIAGSLFATGCPPDPPDFIECQDQTSCGLAVGGQCLVNPETGHQFCAYPDQACPSGMRWSDLDVEGSISGMCIPGEAPVNRSLTVNVGGNGTGRVTSQPAGIDCPGTCIATFAAGTDVELTSSASAGSFLGWSDACNGTGACSVRLDGDRSVGALFGIPGDALWFDPVGSAGGDYARSVVVADGSVYAAGWFTGTVNIGGQDVTSAGGTDGFVAKLDAANGNALWVVRLGGSGADVAHGVAVDAAGDVYVVGAFSGSMNAGGSTLTSAGGNDALVVKLAGGNGAHVWSRGFGGTGNDIARRVVVASTGVIMAGSFGSPSITFGGASLSNAGAGLGDVFLARLAGADGAHAWSVRAGGAMADEVNDLALAADGDVVAVGDFYGTTNLGGANLTSAGMSDIYLAKFDGGTGQHRFSFAYGSTGSDSGTGVAVDSAGKVILTGDFQGTVNLGGTTPLTASGRAILLARFSLAGAHEWSEAFSASGGFTRGGDVAVTASDDVTVIGTFADTISLGGTNLSSAGTGAEVVIGAFRGDTGAHLGSARQGGTGQENGIGIAVASDGYLYCVGHFEGFAEFGGEGHAAVGLADGFIVGLNPL